MWKTCWKILKPYQKFIYLLIAVAFLASLFDGISAGMLVPLLGSLQAERDYSQLPYFLQILATAFSRYTIERQILFSVGMVVLTVLLKKPFLCGIAFYCHLVIVQSDVGFENTLHRHFNAGWNWLLYLILEREI